MALNSSIIVRSLDINKDWVFGSGLSAYAQNNNAIAQNIGTRLNSVLGNCWVDLAAGIDWFNLLGSKNIIPLNLAISTTILNTTGVISIQQLSFSLTAQRQYTATYKVQTTFSSVSNSFTFTTNP
jgi:hypothetical protein